jgi:hypothetical protein
MLNTLLPYWIAILSLGVFLIALRKGWLRGLFSFVSSLIFLYVNKPESEIDLKWEVRRIRRLLEFFYFLTWLGIVFGLFIWSGNY